MIIMIITTMITTTTFITHDVLFLSRTSINILPSSFFQFIASSISSVSYYCSDEALFAGAKY